MSDAKIQPDGDRWFAVVGDGEDAQRYEVDLSGFVSSDQVSRDFMPKDRFEGELKRRMKNLRAPDELLADEQFVDQVVEAHRDTLVKRLGVKADGADVEALKRAWASKELNPVQEKVRALEEELGGLRDRSFEGAFAKAAEAVGVHGSVKELLPVYLKSRMRYDAEVRDWVVVDAQGNPELSPTLGKGRGHQYMTVEDLLEGMKAEGRHREWFDASVRPGAGSGPGGRKALTVDDFERMDDAAKMSLYQTDRQTWGAMMEALRSKGEARLGLG
jgi:hypothetical protein